MKSVIKCATTFLLLVGAVCRGDVLESTIRPFPPVEARDDPERGIFVTIESKGDEIAGSSSTLRSSVVEEVDGVKYSVMRSESGGVTETVRVRLAEETLRHLITDRSEHDILRCVAIRDLPDARLDRKKTTELLTIAAREPKALLRSMAVKEITDIRPRADVVHLLVELLKDPCVSVGHKTLLPLIDHYDLHVLEQVPFYRQPVRVRPQVTASWSRSADGLYHRKQREILRIAQMLHEVGPKLVSPDDLSAIGSREIPSDEWFLNLGLNKEEVPQAKKQYCERFRIKEKRVEQGSAR